MIDLNEQALIRLFLVDPIFYTFMKTQESILVKTVAQSRDRFAALLVLRSNPSYQAFFSLCKEQKIFDSIVETLQKAQQYHRCLHFMRDANFWQATGSAHILRLGFLIHHRMASIKTAEDKAVYANKLPHPMWALLCVFARFLFAIVYTFKVRVFTEIRAATEDKMHSILSFIQELAMFSGLQVIEDFVELRHHPITLEPTPDLCALACAFQSRYLPTGDTILLPKMRQDRLELSSHLSSNVMWGSGSQASIRMGSSIFDCFAEHVYDDILTASGVLPPNEDECALFDALKRVPITDTCYRTTFIEQLPEFQFDYSQS